MKRETKGLIEIIGASVLFGLVPILVKFSEGISSYGLAFFRILVATAFLALIFIFYRKWKLAPFKHEKGKLVFFGAIHGFIILFYFLSIKYLSVASAVLLLYSSSIWIIAFSSFLLGERIVARTFFALAISVIGVILVLFPKGLSVSINIPGSLAGLFAGLGFGLAYTLSKTFKKYDKISLTFWQNAISLPFLLPLFFIGTLPEMSLSNIWLIIALGVFCTAIPFILVYNGLHKVSGQRAGVLILLDMLIPIAFALIFFKEIPTIIQILGGIMIILGSYMAVK